MTLFNELARSPVRSVGLVMMLDRDFLSGLHASNTCFHTRFWPPVLFLASFSSISTRSLYINFQAVSDAVLIVDARRVELTNIALFEAISYSHERLNWRI